MGIPEKSTKKILAEVIYSSLKDDILNADIAAGAVLEESELMNRFGVSRTPVREALRRLVADKLVVMEPHRSAYVHVLTLEEISSFFEAYQIIQRTVFILSADRITTEQVNKIVKTEQEIATAYRNQDIRAIKKLNDKFYGLVAEGSSNTFLHDSYINLREFGSRLSAMIHQSLTNDDWDSHFAMLKSGHAQIISALEKRDCEAISQIADQDVELYKKKVMHILERPLPADPQLISSTIAGRRYF